MLWMKEVEMVDTVDDFMTSPDFEILDAMTASALKKNRLHDLRPFFSNRRS